MVFFHQPRRRQTQHACIPARAGKHDGAAGGEVETGQHGLGLLENFAFHAAALAVFRLQGGGKGFGARLVVRRQKLQPAPGAAQPSAGVQARADLEAQMPGGEGAPLQGGGALERRNPHAGMLVHALQAGAHDEAVFIQQRHHVRHGGKRRQVDVFHGRRPAGERFHQLEGHARAGEVRAGVAVEQRVDQWAGGQRFAGAVMVGDDDIHAQRQGQIRHIHGVHAAVHRHQQIGICRQGAHGLFV